MTLPPHSHPTPFIEVITVGGDVLALLTVTEPLVAKAPVALLTWTVKKASGC
jgi:hypothetical protein